VKGSGLAYTRRAPDYIIDVAIVVSLGLFALSCLYPLYQTLIISLNDGRDALNGGIYVWPRIFSLDNYRLIFSNDRLLTSFLVTVARTVTATLSSIFVTAMLAWGLSRKRLVGRRFYMIVCVITMYFSGGLIPTYLLIRSLGLIDRFLVYILPTLVGVWNMIIFRAFFTDLPDSLDESARMDGANQFTIFVRIVIPVSTPVFAALSLFAAVYNWNEWFTAILYINNRDLLPLQTLLNQLINASTAIEELSTQSNAAEMVRQLRSVSSKTIVASTMIVVTVPIVLVYPFLQKYFVKGIMLGSVKG
jgi:putative aldouronate transport system permease protein